MRWLPLAMVLAVASAVDHPAGGLAVPKQTAIAVSVPDLLVVCP